MTIGAMVYSSNTGLGIQSRSFYNHIKPDRVMVVDISGLNKMKTHHEWYPDAFCITDGFPTNKEIDRFLRGLDVLFVIETPLNYQMFKRAMEFGVKTVLQYNYEMIDYFEHPSWALPDVFAAPTSWNLQDIQDRFFGVEMLPVPIETDVPIKEPKHFQTFLHIAGRPAVADRNGTNIFLQAASLLKNTGMRFVVRIQDEEYGREIQAAYPFVIVHIGDVEETDRLYEEGDVLVMPRKFGGLCLPVHEALARGIPVIMPNCSPNGDLLPEEWLVNGSYSGDIWTRKKINLFMVTRDDLARKMMDFFLMTNAHAVSMYARKIAEDRSWNVLKTKYYSLFERLCNQ